MWFIKNYYLNVKILAIEDISNFRKEIIWLIYLYQKEMLKMEMLYKLII